MQEREILFRGKRVDNGEWVYGFYTLYGQSRGLSPAIITGTEEGCVIPVFIDPETRGEYTGLTDKNGVKIFEGDILFTNKFNNLSVKYIVTYDLSFAAFIGLDKNGMYFATFDGDSECFEVIGNIHDNNPEFLEE